MVNFKSKLLIITTLFLSILLISCSNVDTVVTSSGSNLSGSDIVSKSISNKLSIVTGLNQFDPLDERFKVHFRNISTEAVMVKDIRFNGVNKEMYKFVNVSNNQCVVGESIRPGGTCSVAIGAISALSGLFTGDNLTVSFYSRFGGIGDFDISVPVESFILLSDSKLYMKSLIEGVSAYFYDFGRISVGSYDLQTFKVYNSSGTTRNLFLESQDISFFRIIPSLLVSKLATDSGIPPCTDSIRDGEVCLVDIIYFPSIEESTQTSILTASSVAGGRAGLVAPLQATGTGSTQIDSYKLTLGNIEIDKSYLQFKKVVAVGSVSDTLETFTMTNTTSEPVTFSLSNINEIEYILSGNCTTSRVLSGNASCTLNVRFRPSSAKRSNDLIVVKADNNTVAIPVLATAAQPPAIEGLKYSYVISSRTSNPSDSSYIAIDNVTSVTFPDNPKVDILADKSIYIKVSNTTRDKIFFTENISSEHLYLSGTNSNRCLSSVTGYSSCVIRLDVIPAKEGESFNVFSLHSGNGAFVFPVILVADGDNVTTTSFTINKSALNLYDTEVGSSTSANITVRNNSASNKPIVFTIPKNDNNLRVTTTCLAAGVVADSACDFNVLFTPTKVDNYSREIDIDGVKIPITGKGVDKYVTDTETAINGLLIDNHKHYYRPTEVNAVSKSAKFTLTATDNIKILLTVPSYIVYEKDYSTCVVASDNTISLTTGSSCIIAYSFSPTSEGAVNEAIEIKDASDDKKSTKLKLIAEALPRDKVSLHGYTARGTSKTETVIFANRYDEPVKVGAVSILGYSIASSGAQTAVADATFSIKYDGCSNQIVEPLKSCKMDISFNPTVAGKYVGKIDIPLDGGKPTKRLITIGSTVNNEFVPIIPESSYNILGRPEQNSIAFNNKVYFIGGNHSTHEENNAIKVLNMQTLEWSQVEIDNSTLEFAPYAGYRVDTNSPITVRPMVPIHSVSIRSAKFDIYDGELSVVGGYLSEIPDITATSTTPAYANGKINFLSFIDLETGKWRAPLRMHEFYGALSLNGGSGNNVGTETDRLWGDVSRLGQRYYLTGGKAFGKGTSSKWDTAKFLYYDFGLDNKSLEYSNSGSGAYGGMGVSTFNLNGALFLYHYLVNLGSATLGSNYLQGNDSNRLFVSKVKCTASPGWQSFTSSNAAARLTSGSLPAGNRFSTAYFRSKATKMHNIFIGTSYGSVVVYRIAISEYTDGDPCTSYSATVKGYNKNQTPAQTSSVFVYEDRLWVLSSNLIQVLITTDF